MILMNRKLQKGGEFPDSINLDEENEFVNDDNFQFDYGSNSDSSYDEKKVMKKIRKRINGGKNDDKKDDLDVWQSEKIDLDDI